ncbi:MAG: hypothetical protein LC799_32630, partial [Actinobacteria bacterium]|nr:hypothetical protein [Actinomycetota bacterium]
ASSISLARRPAPALDAAGVADRRCRPAAAHDPGGGQTRGLIDIRDTCECIRLACENPAGRGEFRVFNQMTEAMSVADIAKTVSAGYPGNVEIEYLDNPRVELDEHYYNVVHTGLVDLGLQPHLLSDTLIESLFGIAEQHIARVDLAAMRPTVNWRATANPLR